MSATDISNAKSASTATFVTALVFNAAVFAIELGVFTVLRPYFKAIYEPRTYVPPTEKRIQPLTPAGGSAGKPPSKLSRFIHGLPWPVALLSADYSAIIRANGLDAYFFVRFLRLMIKLLLPIWVVSWIVLLPVTSVRIVKSPEQLEKERRNGGDGLLQFTFGNVGKTQQERYWAHLVCAWFFTIWILFNLKKEMSFFIVTRQQYLTEKQHTRSVQANTILITGIPDTYLTQRRLRELFSDLPGGVKRIWINRNLKDLPEIYDRRMDACNKLEKAEAALLRTAAKLKLKANKQASKGDATPAPATKKAAHKKTGTVNDSGSSLVLESPLVTPSNENVAMSRSLVDQCVSRDQRPTHKLGFLGLFGEKVDTIDWCRKEIAECTTLLEAGKTKIRESDAREGIYHDDNLLEGVAVDEYGNPLRISRQTKTFDDDGNLDVTGVVKDVSGRVVGGVKGAVGGVKDASSKVVSGVKGIGGMVAHTVTGKNNSDDYEPLNSAFVTFNKQIAAHLAVQSLAHHKPYRMSSRYVEVAPSDVIWSNLGLNPYEQKIRMAISYAATAGLILLWAFPVAFVGAISNINKVCAKASWLAWICDLPQVVVGIISGILPPVLLAVLMMLLPIILRLLARFEGIPKYTGLELSLMTRFFLFQALHSFLIVTLSSGIISSLEELTGNPTSIPGVLATNLPDASTFFLTYIVLQGLSGVAGSFLQIVKLVIYYVKLFILGSTPRSVYTIKYTPGHVAWGTLFPSITLLTVITLGYSIISPIINGLSILTFFLLYELYKYLFLYVFQQDLRADTGGLFFPKAIQHVFVGLYIEEICLAALFFLARDENNNASSVAQGALMVVLIVVTAGFHAILNNSYGPLLVALPLSLKNRLGHAVDVEEQGGSDSGPNLDGHGSGKDGFVKPVATKSGTANPSNINDPELAASADLNERVRQGLLVEEEARPRSIKPTASSSPTRSADATGAVSQADHNISKKQELAEVNELEKYGFAHPAASRPQRTLWIPADELGLAREEVEATRKVGVDISCRDAVMNVKGKVDVTGPPPGYSGL